jgi:glutaminyl-tRNA synthetase
MSDATRSSNFLTDIIDADLASGRNAGRVVTRFPPEPNGYLHIGHAKSILLNFGLAARYGGQAHMRFDDTNPTKEETEYVESILADVKWLGCDWGSHLHFASDYFPKMYECAVRLVRDGKAYVDSQPVEAIREQRGSFDRPGVNGPHRERPVAENLALLARMKAGEYPDGACVLRAKIDMSHPNVLMRDPLLYRIRKVPHHRTGDAWCIYPMYDWAHPIEDAIEGITHSICTLEFETNRELYDWVLENTGPWEPRPRQYEFARLALGYTVMSKRKLLQLVTEKRVEGWDDPRMPTLAGLRRRGVTPEALRDFAELIGIAKNNSVVDIGKFEFAVRGDLEGRSPRALAVLDPLPITLTDWPGEEVVELDVPWWPAEPGRGGRKVPFGRDLLIERDDFSADPPPDWKRLAPGREVRLAGGYVIRCEEVVRSRWGEVIALRCSHDPKSLGDAAGDRKRVSGTLNWVEANRSIPSPARLYDRLFAVEQPDAEEDFLKVLNPSSLVVAWAARTEPALAKASPGDRFQFLRQGYFFADPVESKPGAPVWNRTLGLKDSWGAKAQPKADPRTAKTRKVPAVVLPGAAPKKGRAELRAELRAATPALGGAYERYTKAFGLAADQADLLAADLVTVVYFDAAVGVHANAQSVARWLTNELAGLIGDRPLDALPLRPDAFGRFVALVDSGKVTAAAAKSLLADLVASGGEPEARLAVLGLAKVEDAGAVAAAIDRALAAQAAEVARFRAGEKKLFGLLVGAAMREAKGADAGLVRKLLTEKLG